MKDVFKLILFDGYKFNAIVHNLVKILESNSNISFYGIDVSNNLVSNVDVKKTDIEVESVFIKPYVCGNVFNSYTPVLLPDIKGVYLFNINEKLHFDFVNNFNIIANPPRSAEFLRLETSINTVGVKAEPVIYSLTLLKTLDYNTLNEYDDMTIEELERSVILE